MLLARLSDHVVQVGTLKVISATGKTYVFSGAPGPSATIRLHDRALHYKLAFNPSLYFGEAYMDGSLTIEEGTLHDLMEIAVRNSGHTESRLPFALLRKTWLRSHRLRQYNPMGKARRNVAHHYELSDALYSLFLDKDRQYSCAYFTTDNDSLEIAQDNKKRHIATKLLLQPGGKVLDIGSGWGGLALYLAQVGAVEVTGVTLSAEQHKVSAQRAAEAGRSDRVRFHLGDYREEADVYDRIVSVGMFEHVGKRNYDEFFQKVRDLLTEDGVTLLHSIGRFDEPSPVNPYVRKYVFPGVDVPSLSEVLQAVERSSLLVTDIEILRLHYANTLREWRRRFQANRDQVKALYDERFCRMWEFYLTGCEVSFRHTGQMVFQMQLTKRQDAVPLTRDYITEWERAHIGRTNLAARHASPCYPRLSTN